MARRLRRNQNYLVMIGTGVIMIGVWSVIKTISLLMLGTHSIAEYFTSLQSLGVPANLNSLVLILLLCAELFVRLYVGLYARWEGFGVKKGNLYVVLAALLGLFHLTAIVHGLGTRLQYYENQWDAAASLLMDLISLITLFELVNSVFKVRWISHQMELME